MNPFSGFIRKFELLDQDLQDIAEEIETYSSDLKDAIGKYEKARAEATLTVTGTVLEKESQATLATMGERWGVLEAKHMFDVCKIRIGILETRVAAVQSASSLVKAEASLSGAYN